MPWVATNDFAELKERAKHQSPAASNAQLDELIELSAKGKCLRANLGQVAKWVLYKLGIKRWNLLTWISDDQLEEFKQTHGRAAWSTHACTILLTIDGHYRTGKVKRLAAAASCCKRSVFYKLKRLVDNGRAARRRPPISPLHEKASRNAYGTSFVWLKSKLAPIKEILLKTFIPSYNFDTSHKRKKRLMSDDIDKYDLARSGEGINSPPNPSNCPVDHTFYPDLPQRSWGRIIQLRQGWAVDTSQLKFSERVEANSY